jgi:predicted ATP-binding protein involved in virulence
MNKQLILETVRSWADKRFYSAVAQPEVSERKTPPPFVDVRAGLPDAPAGVPGVFIMLQAEPNKSLQIWISSDGAGVFTFMDEEAGETPLWSFLMPDAPSALTVKLSEIANSFMRTLIFEPTLDEWVEESGGSYEFEQLSEFCGEAGRMNVNQQDWTFFRYKWPGSEEIEIVAGFDGSGNAATFYPPSDELSSFIDFDESISGLQNANDLRAWLEKAVGRPSSMTIRKIEVEKLFGTLSYKIDLKTENSATIIHAPNGCGKSTIFNLVYCLLKGRFGALCQVRFDVLALEFDGGRRLIVRQVLHEVNTAVADAEERRRRRTLLKNVNAHGRKETQFPVKCLSVELFDKEKRVINKDEIPIERSSGRSRVQTRNAATRIAFRSINLRAHREGVFDSSTGEFLSFEEVLELYSTPGAGLAKEWLTKLLARNEVHLVRTKRLDAEVVLGRESLREESETIPAAVQHAKELSEILEKKRSEFLKVSQELDGDFVNQLVSSEKIEPHPHKNLQNDLSELALKYGRVGEAGILEGIPSSKIPQLPERAADNPTLTKVLVLYVENQRKKLRVFDEILKKIETIKSLVNERFQMKRLEVSRSAGYKVISEHDESQIPLEGLSSGEQHQLVLFHSLIFGMRPGALIMIDEPEISLHVAWQEIFLRDLELIAKRSGVHFLIATHSPLIIGNKWNLTVSLGDQVKEVE